MNIVTLILLTSFFLFFLLQWDSRLPSNQPSIHLFTCDLSAQNTCMWCIQFTYTNIEIQKSIELEISLHNFFFFIFTLEYVCGWQSGISKCSFHHDFVESIIRIKCYVNVPHHYLEQSISRLCHLYIQHVRNITIFDFV